MKIDDLEPPSMKSAGSVIPSLRNQFIQETKKARHIHRKDHEFEFASTLLLTTGVQCMTYLEEQLTYKLNPECYIECYEDLDCPYTSGLKGF